MARPKKPKISGRQGAFAFDAASDTEASEVMSEFGAYDGDEGADEDADEDAEAALVKAASARSFGSLASLAAHDELDADGEFAASPKLRLLAGMRLEAIVEAIVFASPKPVKPSEITELLADRWITEEHVQKTLDELVAHYEERGGGFRLHHLKRVGYQFQTIEDAGAIMERMFASRPRPISRASLETLAIIAYRQPVTRAEVEFIRGVDAGSIFKTLLERDLIKCVGRKEIVGRPMLFGTTEEFLKVFNLSSVKDLPPLESFQPSREAMQGAADRLAEGDEGLVDVEQYISAQGEGASDGELVGDVESEEELAINEENESASPPSPVGEAGPGEPPAAPGDIDAADAARDEPLEPAAAAGGNDAWRLEAGETAKATRDSSESFAVETALDIEPDSPDDPAARAAELESEASSRPGASHVDTSTPDDILSAVASETEEPSFGQESPAHPARGREQPDADSEVALPAGSGVAPRGGGVDR